MRNYSLGLIGYPLGHSKSPELFKKLAPGIEYQLYEAAAIDLQELSQATPNLIGLNVTIPHKETIIPQLSFIHEAAKEIGAVNTLVKTEDGWHGYNTDYWGFRRSLGPFLKGSHDRALILGTGGAAKAVKYALEELGISTIVVSRDPNKGDATYDQLTDEAIAHHKLIVNCTPLGTWPAIEGCPDIPFGGVGEGHLVVDLVYNPDETLFLKKAKSAGASTLNGSDMLRLQAEKSLEIWKEHGL